MTRKCASRVNSYQVQYFPKVYSVFPDAGSLAGGAKLVIRGSGFSMDERKNAVTVGGVRCDVVAMPAQPSLNKSRQLSAARKFFRLRDRLH